MSLAFEGPPTYKQWRVERRRRRQRAVRARTEPTNRMSLVRLRVLREENEREPVNVERPRTRADCAGSPRPCPFVGCKYHLYLDVTAGGNVKTNFPDLEPWELTESCALDVAEGGGETLETVGHLTNLTRERIRQIEVQSLARLQRSGAMRQHAEDHHFTGKPTRVLRPSDFPIDRFVDDEDE